MLIGGAEDKLKTRRILSRFVRLAGGAEARIVVVSTASMLGEVTTETYKAIFTELGVAQVTGMRPQSRREAEDPQVAATLVEATGVFLTGGNQLRLTSIVAGTRLDSGLHLAHDRGAVIAGTSAGASALAGHMLAFGDSGPTPRHGIVQLAAGLGLVPNTVVDQHFEERMRLGRLLSAIAQSLRSSGSVWTRTRPRSSPSTGGWRSSAGEPSPSWTGRTCRPTRIACGGAGR
jgi:cyanophycinase